MSTPRFARISAFVLFSLTILRSAAQNATNTTSAPTADQLQEYNRICASQAKANGEDAPTNWVWSVTDEGCVNNGASGNSTASVSTQLAETDARKAASSSASKAATTSSSSPDTKAVNRAPGSAAVRPATSAATSTRAGATTAGAGRLAPPGFPLSRGTSGATLRVDTARITGILNAGSTRTAMRTGNVLGRALRFEGSFAGDGSLNPDGFSLICL
ncbi:hypothetical protein CVT26_008632 [Gymnopilus dilepis]|uniref:Pectate lyase n=1 Tax=Gymnopilus dilepis TaxID=231916 RepID=A0A409XXW4_9AGAR|nr:hypothetical protein CVT26_008632 [Gymnopilus dilepis]